MAQRKIRLTMSSHLKDGIGAIVDVDFNGENLDVDLEIDAAEGGGTVVREYTVEAAAGAYDLEIDYKNDQAEMTDDGVREDRNLVLEHLELAHDGVNYETFLINENNCNAERVTEILWARDRNLDHDPEGPKDDDGEFAPDNDEYLLNPDFNVNDTRTDAAHAGFDYTYPGGANAKYIYSSVNVLPSYKYTGGILRINIEFRD